MRVRLDGEEQRTISFRPDTMRHFDHGYAVTSHSSQGLTADRVLINVEVSAHRDLINQRFAYVAVSRAAYDVRLYTDDSARLEKDLGRDVSKSAAIETKFQKENVMNFQNEHAEKKEAPQEPQKMPVEVYVSTLDPEMVHRDVEFADKQREQGVSQPEAVRNLTGDHIRQKETEPPTLSLAERYSAHITELVRRESDRPLETLLTSLQPSAKDIIHWEPAVNALERPKLTLLSGSESMETSKATSKRTNRKDGFTSIAWDSFLIAGRVLFLRNKPWRRWA